MDLICKKVSDRTDILTDPRPMEEQNPVITCRQCLGTVTRPEYGVEIDHGFTHTFANPHGHVFEIGCFSQAQGCVKSSDISQEFSWFKGYAWAIGLCRTCQAQLGWVFFPSRPGNGEIFYGLILDQLIFP